MAERKRSRVSVKAAALDYNHFLNCNIFLFDDRDNLRPLGKCISWQGLRAGVCRAHWYLSDGTSMQKPPLGTSHRDSRASLCERAAQLQGRKEGQFAREGLF